MLATARLDETYLVYRGGEVFRSRLVHGLAEAFDTATEFIYGEKPDFEESPDLFDEWVSIKHDFDDKNLWQEGGAIWETDFSNGFVVVVKVQNLLN